MGAGDKGMPEKARSGRAMIPMLIVLMLTTALSTSLQAGEPVFAPEGRALAGFDVVAYFTQGKAVKGDPSIHYRWNNVEWRFSNEDHRQLFIQSPEKYLPIYGGFCALGAAHGGLVPSSPKAWSIHDGKLIMNMNQDVVETWRYNPDINIERADRNWPTLRERFIASQDAQ